MCDAAYLCQIEALERSALAQVTLLPHLEEQARKDVLSVDQVRANFDEWLHSTPEQLKPMTAEEQEQQMMYRLLGVAK